MKRKQDEAGTLEDSNMPEGGKEAETRKTSNRQPNCTPKTTGKRTTATTTATKLVEGKKSWGSEQK